MCLSRSPLSKQVSAEIAASFYLCRNTTMALLILPDSNSILLFVRTPMLQTGVKLYSVSVHKIWWTYYLRCGTSFILTVLECTLHLWNTEHCLNAFIVVCCCIANWMIHGFFLKLPARHCMSLFYVINVTTTVVLTNGKRAYVCCQLQPWMASQQPKGTWRFCTSGRRRTYVGLFCSHTCQNTDILRCPFTYIRGVLLVPKQLFCVSV